MEDPKEKVCRLCLNYEDNNFRKLDASVIGRVKALIPNLDLSFPNDFLICSKCRDILEKSFEFKRTSTNNNDLILKEKEKLKFTEKVDLNAILNNGNSKDSNSVCRFCLKQKDDNYTYIGKEGNSELNNVAENCLSELDLTLTLKPVVCCACSSLLNNLYDFKKDCLSVEEKIQSYYDSKSSESIDLSKVLMLSRAEEENDFLSGFEVQDEEGTDIFDDISNVQEEKVAGIKRQISEVAQEEEMDQTKKQKLMPEEVLDEELPHFQFDSNLLYNPNKTDIMVEDWLAKVEEFKQKFGWSDYTTIHKVLVKLKDMKELYIWFSNIADIMDWDQWKKKLLLAFPRRSDYHIHLKKMMMRRKKKEETYVTYYADKIKLMECLNLTDEQKVSCIFGGITDVLVCCVGRVGDYKNPEELLDYFKSCDDKQLVEAAAEVEKETKPVRKVVTTKLKVQNQQFPNPNQNNLIEKKKKIKCYECHRYGHTVVECRMYKIGAHMDNVDGLKVQNNPKISESQARRPSKKSKPGITCHMCGKVGHTMKFCRLQKKLKLNKAPQQKQPPMKPNEYAEGWCSNCHQPGHSVANCFNTWPKKMNKTENANPSQNQRQNRNDNDWTQCPDGGQYGSKANPCCSPMTSYEESYIGSYSAENLSYNKHICLRCYKTGHNTKDCEEFSHRTYRN